MVMMYVRFPLSLRNVENLLFERGIRSAAFAQWQIVAGYAAILRDPTPPSGDEFALA